MGFFKSKEEKDAIKAEKDRKAESKVIFTGTATQPIGKIQPGWIVDLTLDPDEQRLHIKNKKESADITIPYERLREFHLEDETTLEKSGGTVGRAVVGGLLFGPAGAVVGGMSGKGKTKTRWFGTLVFENKDGDTEELIFVEFLSFKGGNPASVQFKTRVNAIAASNRPDITEL